MLTPTTAVVFLISCLGDSVDAGRFVHHLSVDPELRGMVYCNKTKLDEQLAGNSSTLKNRSVSFAFRRGGRV